MGKVPNIIPITDLRQDAAGVLKRVKGTKEPIIITQRGRAAAVMMSTDAYEKAEHDRQLLRLLARGDKEIAAGKGYDLETIMAEAGFSGKAEAKQFLPSRQSGYARSPGQRSSSGGRKTISPPWRMVKPLSR